VVTVKHPESNKPKPTVKKNKPIQADLDVAKEFSRCKEEGFSNIYLISDELVHLLSLFSLQASHDWICPNRAFHCYHRPCAN
jgi:hypothetical protein